MFDPVLSVGQTTEHLDLSMAGFVSGTIRGNGDRKSCDPRAPMIWDNFALFGKQNY